ncbi:hypothetical protein ZHAS_00012804 [Anopheles sinensis]|uniref:Uncharacterized protein n=1 Tax=Anopheles sinensis TaxID=74873 RepID=A0A084W3U9_ANOSI|nr:hypothetical protein ZHAS_00012804 [Anopheles sinensis]
MNFECVGAASTTRFDRHQPGRNPYLGGAVEKCSTAADAVSCKGASGRWNLAIATNPRPNRREVEGGNKFCAQEKLETTPPQHVVALHAGQGSGAGFVEVFSMSAVLVERGSLKEEGEEGGESRKLMCDGLVEAKTEGSFIHQPEAPRLVALELYLHSIDNLLGGGLHIAMATRRARGGLVQFVACNLCHPNVAKIHLNGQSYKPSAIGQPKQERETSRQRSAVHS